MFSYYFQNRSYYFANDLDVVDHLNAVNKIVANSDQFDHFVQPQGFYDGIYDRWGNTVGSVLKDSSRTSKYIVERVLPRIRGRCKIITNSYNSIADMNVDYHNTSNAFLCASTRMPTVGIVVDYKDYVSFRSFIISQTVGSSNFKKCCQMMLKKVVLTKDAYDMVRPYGKMVKQIYERLLQLDHYLLYEWKKGVFNEGDVAAKTPLTISDESDSVKRDRAYNHHRYFRIPEIGGQFCFLHIKTGVLRFHIYPDDSTKTIYVPYIGPHLPTPENP